MKTILLSFNLKPTVSSSSFLKANTYAQEVSCFPQVLASLSCFLALYLSGAHLTFWFPYEVHNQYKISLYTHGSQTWLCPLAQTAATVNAMCLQNFISGCMRLSVMFTIIKHESRNIPRCSPPRHTSVSPTY